MKASALTETVLVGALTGMRSMAGPAMVVTRYGGPLQMLAAFAAIGEMIADKTTLVPNRIEPVPLTGRAAMGAIAGAVIARHHRHNMVAGGALGAAAAVITAHLAFRLRMQAPMDTVSSGFLEDAVVAGIGWLYAAPQHY